MHLDCTPPIEAEAHASALRVVVTDADGLPIPGVRVQVGGPCLLGPVELQTDEEGVVRFTRLDALPTVVTVEREGFDTQTREVGLLPGRTTLLNVTLRLELRYEEFYPPPVLPEHGRRGGSIEENLLQALPWVSLGGAAGLLEHPALGVGKAEPTRILGLAVPAAALSAVPRGVVGGLEARSVALESGDHASIGLARGGNRDAAGALELAGAVDGEKGAAATVSGPVAPDRINLAGGLETGLLGGGAGFSALVWPGASSMLEAMFFRSEEVWVAGLGGWYYNGSDVSLHLSGVAAMADEQLQGRAALHGTFSLPSVNSHDLSVRAEGLGAEGRGAALLSAHDAWSVWVMRLFSSARVRLDPTPQVEAQLGLASREGTWVGYALAGQRYEGLEALEGSTVRSREVLVGGGTGLGRLDMMLTALGAERMDTLTGEALPGRADVQIAVRGELWPVEGVGTITWRPPVQDFNADLAQQEAGLLVALPPSSTDPFSPTAGLGLRAARQDGALSASAAARVGLFAHGDRLDGTLALEGNLGEDTPGALWLSLKVEASQD